MSATPRPLEGYWQYSKEGMRLHPHPIYLDGTPSFAWVKSSDYTRAVNAYDDLVAQNQAMREALFQTREWLSHMTLEKDPTEGYGYGIFQMIEAVIARAGKGK